MNRKKGATIIEIIIYTFLAMTLLIVLTEIFSLLMDQGRQSVSFSEVETDAKFINQKILNHFSTATLISTPATLNSPADNLSFSSETIDYLIYLSGNNLYISEEGEINRLNSYGTEITSLTVNRFGNSGGKSVLKISYDIKSTIIQAKGFEQKTVNLTAAIR